MDQKNSSTLYGNIRFKTHSLSILLIIILGLSVYANSLKGGFLWDDRFLVEENYLIRDWGNILKIFKSPITPDFYEFYRPMANISLMLDYHLWGLKPAGYHLTNIILHSINAGLVYILVFLLSRYGRISLMCGLVFAVHTILTEPVNYISSRADLLLAFFFLLSFVFYAAYRNSPAGGRKYYFYALLSFIMGLLSKEMAIILPIVLITYDFVFNEKTCKGRELFRLYLPFFAIVVIYTVLRLTLLKFSSPGLYIPKNTIADLLFTKRFFTSITVIPVCLRLFVFPFGLHKGWLIRPVDSIFQFNVIMSVFFVIAILMLAKIIYKYSRLSCFAILWFFLLFSPHLNIFPLNAFLSEGWLYMPAVGFILFFSSILVKFVSLRRVYIFILVLVLSYYSVLTVSRNNVWAGDPEIFYKDILRYNPYEDRIHNVLGNLYFDQGRLEEAFSEYKTARDLNPNKGDIYYNLGNVYYRQNRLDEAMAEFKKALDLAPKYAEAHNNLGLVYFKQEKIDMAGQEFKRTLDLAPNNIEARFNLGNLYFKQGEYDKAIDEYEKVLRINPDYVIAYNNLGRIYFMRGNYKEAEIRHKKAIDINPNRAQFHGDLGNVYSRERRLDDAITEFKKAIALDPNISEAYNDLGSAYFEKKDYNQAIMEYGKALVLNPDYADVYYNLGVTYYSLGIYKDSRANFEKAIDLFNKQNNKKKAEEVKELLSKIDMTQ